MAEIGYRKERGRRFQDMLAFEEYFLDTVIRDMVVRASNSEEPV
jgi:hypothetical protein